MTEFVTSITEGVKVSVETYYYPEHSIPHNREYVFAYRITIENRSPHTIQLLNRHWFIYDSFIRREVKGAGVIGQQPVLEPGESHQYISGCNLTTEIGKMFGAFTMTRVHDGSRFLVNIPAFLMVVPHKLN